MGRSIRNDQSGAIAVFFALVLSLAILPIAALGISSYVRSGTRGELQRSADAAALAGARSIALSSIQDVLLPPPGPLTVACDEATAAVAADDTLGKDYEVSRPADWCDAEYEDDADFVDKFYDCAVNVDGLDPDLPPELEALAPTYPTLVAQAEEALDNLVEAIRDTLPALQHRGVAVTLERTVAGPLDDLGGAADSVEEVTSVARRRVKNVALLPVVHDPVANTYSLDPNAEIGSILSGEEAAQQIRDLDALIETDPTLGEVYTSTGCSDVFDTLADDVADIYNPGAGTPSTPSEVLEEAQDQGAAVLSWVQGQDPEVPEVTPTPTPTPSLPVGGLPGLPSPSPSVALPSTDLTTLLQALQIPFFDFLPVCVTSTTPLDVDFTSCAAGDGAFRATLVR